MYQVLVVMRMTSGPHGGRAATMQLLQFDTLAGADAAMTQLTLANVYDMTIIPLWK